jgi:alkylation response protein AidB-like acyl-CoA dehydrogenase
MTTIKDEQEVLLAIADIAINIFAIESAVLRAEKIMPALSDAKKGIVTAAVKVFTFNAAERTATAARKAAYFIEEGDNLTVLLGGVRRFTKYDATGLLREKRLLANAAIEAEKYVF